VVLLLVAAVQAQELKRHSIPDSWIEPLLPEALPPLKYPEYYNELDKARAQVKSGRYRLALATLHAAPQVDPAEAMLVRGQTLAALGRRDLALATLSDPAVRDRPEAQVLSAIVLAELGRLGEAIERLTAHLAAHPNSIAGRFQLGRAYEQAGDLEAARRAYGWFVDEKHYLDKWEGQSDPVFDSAESVTLVARAIDRHAALTEAYRNNVPLHGALLNMFVRAYDQIDRSYSPAHVAAAEYFMWHDQDREASQELQAALRGNPNDAEALRLAALMALQTYDFDAAESAISDLRDVEPESIQASLLEARSQLRQRRPQQAERLLRQVLAQQPRNTEAMGLLSSSLALQLRQDEADELLRTVDSIDVGHDDATACNEVAEQLAAMRQYPRSAAMFQRAIDRAGWWTAPRNGLGLLYTQSGDEDLARATLEQARALDPFNLATTNYLRMLDDLAGFDRTETAHFVILYDRAADPLIAGYFADYLESIYPQVTGAFAHEPDVKTFIEVFPTHDGFSVRTTGSPWIGTVGASTGRVIAMVSPRKGQQTMGPFHWATVLRHEFTHTVTLSATENRIPHWMTEGLAVLEEGTPLKWDWAPLLYKAVSKNQLFPMDELTWGFVRPRKPTDRTLAYAESYWACVYIEQTFGRDAILRMLDAFRAGQSEAQVFRDVLGRSQSAFTAEFFAWAAKQVQGWGYDEASEKRYDELRDQGESLVQARQFEQAVPVWQQIQQLRPMDALPRQRLAGLYIRLGRPQEAREHLVALHQSEIKDNRYAKRLARIDRDLGQTEGALTYAREAVYIEPYDPDAHELLAELYERAGDAEGAARERKTIVILEDRATNPQ
jgi:Flp pilus assembly protein TadD